MKYIYAIFFALLPLMLSAVTIKSGDLAITIRDGRNNEELIFKQTAPGILENGKGLEITFKESGIFSGKRFDLKFQVPKNSQDRYLLAVEAVVQTNASGYFDGFAEHKFTGKSLVRDNIYDNFPLTAAYDDAKFTALGITPDTVSGYTKAEYTGKELKYLSHVVADNYRSQDLGFVLFSGAGEFGWKNAVDCYYRSFPEFFRPADGIDQRIYGVGGYMTSTHLTRNMEIHAARYVGMTWEWTYVPWNRAGEWYVDKEDWKDGDGYLWYDKYMANYPCTYEQYHDFETYRYKSGNRQAAMFHYVLVKDIWHTLVEKYPDSLHEGPDGTKNAYSFNHSRADNKGKTRSAFAYGSGLSGYLENEIRKAVENYEIAGFAFDMANWDYNEYCPAQLKYARGRTWDKNGRIFTPTSVIPIPFAEYIHTLKRNGKRMAVYNNQALENHVAHSVFYTDAVMFEGNPEIQLDNILSLRLMAGQKPMTFWANVGMNSRSSIIRWNMAREAGEFSTEIYNGLADLLLGQCLLYGATPMSWAVAYQQGTYFKPHLPLLEEIKRAGWQVVPAASGYGDLWLTRYGTDKNTIFTIYNPSRQTVDLKIRLHRKYLGSFVPMATVGTASVKELSPEFFEVSVKIAPKKYAVLRDKDYTPVVTSVLGDSAKITGFFTMDDARNRKAMVVFRNDKLKSIYDFFDRYYPYVAAGKQRVNHLYTREVFKNNPFYNHAWRLFQSKAFAKGKNIAIGSAEDFAELFHRLSPAEKDQVRNNPAGFIKFFPDRQILWVGGKDYEACKKASDTYFDMMDNVLQP